MRLFYLMIAFLSATLGLSSPALAQQPLVLQGAVLKLGTAERVDSAAITNKRTHGKVLSNRMGLFSLLAIPGDTLELSGRGCENLVVVVTAEPRPLYYLKPYAATELNTVVITGSSTRKNLLEAQRAYRSKGVFYTGTPHYYYLFLKPMTFIYENFKGEVRQARKFRKLAKAEEEYEEVALRFNNRVIKKYTTINDGQLDEFKTRYWPAATQLKHWSDYELIAYIKRSFAAFSQPEVLEKPAKP